MPRRGQLLAAGIALLAIGAAGDRLMQRLGGTSVTSTAGQAGSQWRAAVAQYLRLYTSQTLAAIPDDAATQMQALAVVASGIGLRLSPADITLPEIALKQSQLLQYDGQPLG